MTRTITLPIKCSTVRKTSDALSTIIKWEIPVAIITFVLWMLDFKISNLTSSVAIEFYTIAIVGTLLWCGLMLFLWLCVVIYDYLETNFPHPECIKDTEEP